MIGTNTHNAGWNTS